MLLKQSPTAFYASTMDTETDVGLSACKSAADAAAADAQGSTLTTAKVEHHELARLSTSAQLYLRKRRRGWRGGADGSVVHTLDVWRLPLQDVVGGGEVVMEGQV